MKHVTVRILCIVALVTAAVAMAGIVSSHPDAAAHGKAQVLSMMTPF